MPKPIKYSHDELAWIKANCTLPRRQAHQAFCQKFSRDDVSLVNFNSLCKRNGWLTGRTGRYDQGITPWNKGKPMPYNENTARTQFKPGNRPHNTKYAGHERITKDGYVEISINETNPHTGFKRRYVLKHRYLWEKLNGPLPAGMCLKSLDGNKSNADPTNWVAVPRAMLPRLNGRFGRNYDQAEPELKPLILTTAKLEHQVREKRKNKSGEPVGDGE